MRFSFVRSGGFAAVPALRVHAAVDLEERAVTAEPDYRRTLDPEEARRLADAIDRIADDPPSSPAARTPARDAFVFQISFESSSGRRGDVTTTESDALNRSAALAELVEWAGREAETIVRTRLHR